MTLMLMGYEPLNTTQRNA